MYNTDVMRIITSKVHTICLIPSRNTIITLFYIFEVVACNTCPLVDTYLERPLDMQVLHEGLVTHSQKTIAKDVSYEHQLFLQYKSLIMVVHWCTFTGTLKY
jgi:hypothetical protein